VTANEPPNPYAAPDNAGPDPAQAPRPSRVLAALTSLVAYPLVGTGLFILGRRRRFAVWVTVGLVLGTAMIVGVRLPSAKLFMIALAGLIGGAVLAVIDTALARPANGLTGGRAWMVAIAIVLIAKGGALAIRHTLVEAFKIPSGAMIPTLRIGDHIFVKKGNADVGRGDVVVFEFPLDRSTDYVKRVVAVGGDTVEVRNDIVSINGTELPQAEIKNEPNPCPAETGEEGCNFARETSGDRTYTIMFAGRLAPDAPRLVVPEGHVFVLGDNRDNSYDSRKWGFVPVDHIKGKATLIWWSKQLSRVGGRID